MKFSFFNHPVKDNQKFKLVLFGLPQINTKEIIEEFQLEYNIELISIKETIRSNTNDAIYMIEFNRDQISKKEVRKIKYVFNIVVQWRNPLRSRNGATQCKKCTMYGHGAANSHMKLSCNLQMLQLN